MFDTFYNSLNFDFFFLVVNEEVKTSIFPQETTGKSFIRVINVEGILIYTKSVSSTNTLHIFLISVS